jgi:hypothetical protein
MGAAAFEQAWTGGRVLRSSRAVAYALEDTLAGSAGPAGSR